MKEKLENESSTTKQKPGAKQAPTKSRNLWITNISQNTRATELKQALSEYGKVIGAKVVINAKYPGACCYGYVTMETAEDADNCIAKLNNTELNGQIIKIEKVRTDHMNMKTKQKSDKEEGKTKSNQDESEKNKKDEDGKKDAKEDKEKDKDGKEVNEKHSLEKKDSKRSDSKKPESLSGKSDHKKRSHSYDRHRHHEKEQHGKERRKSRSKSRGDRSLSSKSKARSDKERDMLTFDKIKEERERQRLREKERILREESRRRREEALRQREIERQQRSEAARLEREREKLRIEREKLEREKAEIIRLERERQKLEREKLELEKLELQRAKMRLQEEDRRPVKRAAPYRDDPYDERKRITNDRRYEEAPPAPRYEAPSTIKAPSPPRKIVPSKEYKSRDRSHASSMSRGPPPPTAITKYEGSSVFNISRERDVREARSRESNSNAAPSGRYDRDRDRSPHYRVRDDRDRRAVPDHKSDVRSRDHRYDAAPKDTGRFEGRGGNNWPHPGTPSGKPFTSNSTGGTSSGKSWNKDSWRSSDSSGQDRWNSSNTTRTSGSLSSGAFSNSSNMNMTPSCPPPPGINNYSSDRFDYKSMSGMRKY
ncbi:scaffold attachment factor B2 isoform X5 [Agrilus planipennis]|uniref:Scaffold attachment factor B2 isoform X5 n=1 Tax=Agrilus planipennis TaxID=224129 RepID=A0A1W4WRJ5_AGRPL|nr:scaffold attachment factor B2 isoform X5 [Agrilus planipennis]